MMMLTFKKQFLLPYTCSKELNFYLFADDTNIRILYADRNLNSLENTVNAELHKLYLRLTSNKLNLNIKKIKFRHISSISKETIFLT